MRNAMKKFVAVVLTVVMLLSMAVPAFAAPNTSGHNPTTPVSLTIVHDRMPFAPPGDPMPPGVGEGWPGQGPGGIGPGSPGGQPIHGSNWSMVRLLPPTTWTGTTIPDAVVDAVIGAAPHVTTGNNLLAPIQTALTALAAPNNNWQVTSNRLRGTTDVNGVLTFTNAIITGAGGGLLATSPLLPVPASGAVTLTNNVHGQGIWLVWDSTPADATLHVGPALPENAFDFDEAEERHAPFLVTLPTFVHESFCPEHDMLLPDGTWDINCLEDCTHRVGWVYNVRVHPKQAPPPPIRKTLDNVVQGSEIINAGTVNERLVEYSILSWRFGIQIQPDLTHIAAVYRPYTIASAPNPAVSPVYPGFPELTRLPVMGPGYEFVLGTLAAPPANLNTRGGFFAPQGTRVQVTNAVAHANVVNGVTTADGWVMPPEFVAAPNAAAYGYGPRGGSVARPNRVTLTYESFVWPWPGPTVTHLNPAVPPSPNWSIVPPAVLPTPAPGNWQTGASDITAWPAGSELLTAANPVYIAIQDVLDPRHWVQRDPAMPATPTPEQLQAALEHSFSVFYYIGTTRHYVPRMTGTVENWILVHNRIVVGATGNAANPDIWQEAFWLYITDAGRRLIDQGDTLTNFYITFRTRSEITCPDEIRTLANTDVWMQYGRRPRQILINLPGCPDNRTAVGAARVNKINPNRQPLDSAVFYLFCRSQLYPVINAAQLRLGPAGGARIPGEAGYPGVEPAWPAPIDFAYHTATGVFPLGRFNPTGAAPTNVRPQPIRRAITGVATSLTQPGDADILAGTDFTPPWQILPIWAATNQDGTPAQGIGEGVFTNLIPGHYYIFERLAPPGYRRIDGFRRIEIVPPTCWPTVGGVRVPCTVANCTDCEDWEDYTLELEITNTRDFYLPLTGGAGTIMFTAAGVSLMGGAGLFLFLARKKEKVQK